MSVIFNSIRIERKTWGDDEGKLFATLDVEGKSAKMVIKLAPGVAERLLAYCADEIASAASEEAQAFRSEFLASINAKPSVEAKPCGQ